MVARCKPLTKDHLSLTTTFPGPKGWSLVTGFTVLALCILMLSFELILVYQSGSSHARPRTTFVQHGPPRALAER